MSRRVWSRFGVPALVSLRFRLVWFTRWKQVPLLDFLRCSDLVGGGKKGGVQRDGFKRQKRIIHTNPSKSGFTFHVEHFFKKKYSTTHGFFFHQSGKNE